MVIFSATFAEGITDESANQTEQVSKEIPILSESMDSSADISMNRIFRHEEEPNPCVKPCCCEPIIEPCVAKLMDSCCCYKNGLKMDLEFLYWRAFFNTSPYVWKNTDESKGALGDPNFVHITDIKGNRIDSDWDPGLRFGLGYNFSHGNFDLTAVWTYYHTHQEKSKRSQDFDLTGLGQFNTFINFAKSELVLNYNMFDLELGKTYYFREKLALRPHLGVSGGSVYKRTDGKYEDALVIPNGRPVQTPYYLNANHDFWGVGPRLGIDGYWHFTSNFSFFGKGGFSLLFGKVIFNADTEYFNNGIAEHLKGDESYKTMKPIAQILFGFCYGSCYCDDQYFFGIDIAAEYNYLWDQNFFKYLSSAGTVFSNYGALDFFGFNIGARFEF